MSVALSLPEYDSLLLRHLLPLTGGVGPEELCQHEPPGQAADQDPVGVEPGEADGGQECDPDADDVGQVEMGVIIVGLSQGVGDHPEISSRLLGILYQYQYLYQS